MLRAFNLLLNGRSPEATETDETSRAMDRINQKVRDAETVQRAAQSQLASLIQRERIEQKLLAQIEARISNLTQHATDAIAQNRTELACESCRDIAEMENSRDLRWSKLAQIKGEIVRVRQNIENGHRRIIALRQGALRVRALRREANMQIRLGGYSRAVAAEREADGLIESVLRKDSLANRVFPKDREGPQSPLGTTAPTSAAKAGKTTAADIMARLAMQTRAA